MPWGKSTKKPAGSGDYTKPWALPLTIALLLPLLGGAGRGVVRPNHARSGNAAAQRRTHMLAEKIKQLADRMLDKHATLQSVAEHIGPWKQDAGSPECDLTPRDKDFQSGDIGAATGGEHPEAPIAGRPPAYLDLTLAKDIALHVSDLAQVFGKPHPVTPPPHGNPYSVVFYYPDDKALLSVAVFAELSGPPEDAATRVKALLLRRDDMAEAFRH